MRAAEQGARQAPDQAEGERFGLGKYGYNQRRSQQDQERARDLGMRQAQNKIDLEDAQIEEYRSRPDIKRRKIEIDRTKAIWTQMEAEQKRQIEQATREIQNRKWALEKGAPVTDSDIALFGLDPDRKGGTLRQSDSLRTAKLMQNGMEILLEHDAARNGWRVAKMVDGTSVVSTPTSKPPSVESTFAQILVEPTWLQRRNEILQEEFDSRLGGAQAGGLWNTQEIDKKLGEYGREMNQLSQDAQHVTPGTQAFQALIDKIAAIKKDADKLIATRVAVLEAADKRWRLEAGDEAQRRTVQAPTANRINYLVESEKPDARRQYLQLRQNALASGNQAAVAELDARAKELGLIQ